MHWSPEAESEAAEPAGAVEQGERVAVAGVDFWSRAGEGVSGAAASQVEGARGAGESQAAGGLVAGEGADVGVRPDSSWTRGAWRAGRRVFAASARTWSWLRDGWARRFWRTAAVM